MSERYQAPVTGRCKALNKRGQACRAIAVGADGYCPAHSGKQDMRELGRLGGRASGGIKPEQVPQSLREELRTLDPKIVRAAVEQALTGGNEAARVSAVKLLSDLDVYGGKECPVCAKNAAIDVVEVRAKLARLLEGEQAQAVELAVDERTRELTEQLEAVRAEHSTG